MTLQTLEKFIDELLQVADKNGDEPAGVWIDSQKQIQKFGLALEPTPKLREWIDQNQLDALFLHRPWKLDETSLPTNFGVLAYHRAFDNLLSVGYNPHLASDLKLQNVEIFEFKNDFPLGMIGDCEKQTWTSFLTKIEREFNGVETIVEPRANEIKRIAVVGAMTDELVRKAFDAGANIYLSGQIRVPAREAIKETGIGVIATGHARAELWGLRKLTTLLKQQFPQLQIVVAPTSFKNLK